MPERGAKRLPLFCIRNTQFHSQAFIEKASSARFCTLVADRFYVESEIHPPIHDKFGVPYDQFHTVAYVKELFPQAEISPPVSPERQHCCVLRK